MKDRVYYIKTTSPYITGVVGNDIKLSFKNKIKILFCKKVSVCFVGDGSRRLNLDVLKPFWFITVLNIPDINKDDICNIANQRCWGFYTNKESAIMALHSNATDMYERTYNYAVLEEYCEGISNCNTQNRQFFKYNKERDGYFAIEEPSIFKHWSGFALG